jgi:predicted 3-demethylubiquinone-9 3-methyltransferase (glyoxalase superfamily)
MVPVPSQPARGRAACWSRKERRRFGDVDFARRRTTIQGVALAFATDLDRGSSMQIVRKIAPCLWFDDQAEAAAGFYTGIFRNSKIVRISRYGKAGQEVHRRPPGSVLTVAFELDGQLFTALNGGPVFKFNEAISLQVFCETQEEVDYYWERLSAGGDAAAQQCGWLKDRFGVSCRSSRPPSST